MGEQTAVVEAARALAEVLYTGEQVAHRSCGVAVAETFGCAPKPYAVLRRGGLTGEGECGAVRAGEMVLAELMAADDPAAALPPSLTAAIAEYRQLCAERLDGGPSGRYICNELTAVFTDFHVPPRQQLCTSIAATIAGSVAEVALKHGATVSVASLPDH